MLGLLLGLTAHAGSDFDIFSAFCLGYFFRFIFSPFIQEDIFPMFLGWNYFYTLLKACFNATTDSITTYQNLLAFIIKNASC